MAYYNEDQLYRLFDKAINAQANERIEKLKNEIGFAYAKQMKKVRADITLNANLALNKGLRELSIEYQDSINKIGVGYDETLIKKRQEMTDYVFEGVHKKLRDFMTSSAYQSLILSKIEEVKKVIDQDGCIFKIAKHDKQIKDVIDTNVVRKHQFEIDPNIQFGGFIVCIPKQNLEINQTIDMTLESQKKWFYKHSKLFIRD